MYDHTLSLPGAPCESCWGAVRTALTQLEGLQAFKVHANPDPSIEGGIVEFSFSKNSNLSLLDVIQHIDSIGFEAIEQPSNPESNSPEIKACVDGCNNSKAKNHLKYFWIAFCTGFPLLLLTALGITLPLYAMWAIAAVSLSAVLYTGWDVFQAGIKNVVGTGKPTMHTLFSISVIVASSVSVAALFFPMLPFEFASALLILSSHHIGKFLEARMKKSITAKEEFDSRLPKTVSKIIRNQDLSIHYEEINIADIKIGDVIEVKQGNYLPVDGKLLSGNATFKKTIYNGNLLPETEFKNAPLYAGTQLMSEEAQLMVTSNLQTSSLAHWQTQLKQAQGSRAKTQIERIADKISKYFIPGVLAVSILTFAIAFPLFGPMVALHSTIAILVGACPCTLGFITPLATHVSREKSRELGAIINNPDSIEIGNKIDIVIMDLNGTLTKGRPVIEKIHYVEKSSSEIERKEALKAIALLENNVKNQHPVGQALLEFARSHKTAMSLDLTLETVGSIKEKTCGVEGIVNRNKYLLGNSSFMQANQINVKDHPNRQYLAKEGKLFAYFEVSDPLRKDALSTIEGLQAQSIKVEIASGSSLSTVTTQANALHIDKYHADLRSHEKEALIKKYQAQGLKVAMIGDGLNDAIALQTADIGIALANADELNKHSADVLIHKDALLPACHFFKNCKQAMNVIKQNFSFSFIYNALVMTLSMLLAQLFGSLTPAIMALSMGLQSLLILGNTYRLKQTSPASTTICVEENKEQLNNQEDTPEATPFFKSNFRQPKIDLSRTFMPISPKKVSHKSEQTNVFNL